MNHLNDLCNMEHTRRRKIISEIFDLSAEIQDCTKEARCFAVSPTVAARLRDIDIATKQINALITRLQ